MTRLRLNATSPTAHAASLINSDNARYSNATTMYVSSERKVSDCTVFAVAVSSSAEICDAIAEDCIIRRNWLVSAGYTFSMDGCSITCQPIRQRDRPRHS